MSKKKPYISEKDVLEAQGRIPPQAIEAEESILGSMMIEPEAIDVALELLQPDDFYKPMHQTIFSAFKDLNQQGQSIDIITVEEQIKKMNQDVPLGVILDLTRSVTSAANIAYHCQIVREKSMKRKIIYSSTELITEAYDNASDPYVLVEKAQQNMSSFEHDSVGEPVFVGDKLDAHLDYLDYIRESGMHLAGIPSGTALDDFTGGFIPGELTIIAARPSMGKSALMLTIARNAAIYHDARFQGNVGILSLEMSEKDLINRLISLKTAIPVKNFTTGKINDAEARLLRDSAADIKRWPIVIDDQGGISLRQARSKARKMKRKNGIKLLIIDYLQLMNGFTENANNRDQEIGIITRGLKAMAKDLNIAIIALSQLSRKVEDRSQKRPQLSDLRESGNIEQDADVVIFLHRPEYYGIKTDEDGNPTANKAFAIIAKQRQGPLMDVPLFFNKTNMEFKDYDSTKEKPTGQTKASHIFGGNDVPGF